MRIIAGEFRRRLLLTPKDAEVTRPIPDRVKESLFSLLRGHCEGATVFDAFAGTGAIGLEAVSRGAARCVMVEKDRGIAAILRKNIETLGVGSRCEVVEGDALGPGALARAPRPLTLAFLDPPYPIVQDLLGFQRVMEQMKSLIPLLTDDGFAIVRTPWPLQHQEGAENLEPEPQERPRWTKGKRRRGMDEASEGRSSRRSPRPPNSPTSRRGPGIERLDLESADLDDEMDGAELIDFEGEDGGDFVDLQPEEGANSGMDEHADDVSASAPKPKWKAADLTIPGAAGPETHVYGSMAVHLYMKAKK